MQCFSKYDIDIGEEKIPSLAFRKCKQLAAISLPDGLLFIGDAAFSFCVSLHKICIPASVNFIGVAAFYGSSLEDVTFKGVPEIIEPAIFKDCKRLKRIIVPRGQKPYFCKVLGVESSIIVETDDNHRVDVDERSSTASINFKQKKQALFTYNQHDFKWSVGDSVKLDELFSGPTALIGNPSYQFRRKALFIFLHSDIANRIGQNTKYEIPANVAKFMQKYQEKYNSRTPRIFLFVCDDGKAATFYDEVNLEKTNKNSITIKSLMRI